MMFKDPILLLKRKCSGMKEHAWKVSEDARSSHTAPVTAKADIDPDCSALSVAQCQRQLKHETSEGCVGTQAIRGSCIVSRVGRAQPTRSKQCGGR